MTAWIHSLPLGRFFALFFVSAVLLLGVAETVVSVLMWHEGVPWSHVLESAGSMFVITAVATGAERSRRVAPQASTG